MSDDEKYTTIMIKITVDDRELLRKKAAQKAMDPRILATHVLHLALAETPANLEHVTAPPTAEDFNLLIDCINALAEMVTA